MDTDGKGRLNQRSEHLQATLPFDIAQNNVALKVRQDVDGEIESPSCG